MASVKAIETAPREVANSACTAGSVTTTDHIPTPPTEEMARASARRTHARWESGMNWVESV
jgi:hypothetical protein